MADLNPTLHQATRLRIMAYLWKARVTGFVRLRDALGLTDGNLAGHLQRLETAGYVSSRRTLRGLHFEVEVAITPAGRSAMADYIVSLRRLVEDLGTDENS